MEAVLGFDLASSGAGSSHSNCYRAAQRRWFFNGHAEQTRRIEFCYWHCLEYHFILVADFQELWAYAHLMVGYSRCQCERKPEMLNNAGWLRDKLRSNGVDIRIQKD